MSAESTGSRGFHYWRLRFRAWRGNRPFWGGLFTMIGGVPIAYLPYGDMRLGNMTLAMATTAGAGALIIGVLLITLGLTMWFQPVVRVFAGVAAIVLGLVSIPVSNFGGLVVGFLCSLIGGGLSVSWAPGVPVERSAGQTEAEAATHQHEYDGPPLGAEGDEGRYAFGTVTVPEQRAGQEPDPLPGPGAQATESTIDANGGRNSAG
ncbi:DUF6114 domain-containing protein [Streptomyces sp. NPDC054861]